MKKLFTRQHLTKGVAAFFLFLSVSSGVFLSAPREAHAWITFAGIANQGGQVVQDTVDAVGNVIGGIALSAILSPIAVVSFVVLSLASFFLWLAGLVFNLSVGILVFQFGTYLGNSTGMLAAWGILRDFGNMLLLFGFVYMGIQTILQIGHFNVGRSLSRLIIFAVLLNFSLFVAEAVIDTSNVLASSVYQHASQNQCASSEISCIADSGIASLILQQAGVLGIINNSRTASVNSAVDGLVDYVSNPVGETLKLLGLSVLVTAAAVVLFAGAFLLISRAIHLAFLMVTSPIGFAGMAVPWLEKMANDWWSSLIKQAMFAPVFLILIFVGLKLLEGLGAIGGNGSIGEAMSFGSPQATGAILLFVLVIGFMIGAMLVAKQFGIYGADAVTKWGTGVVGRVAGASTLGVAGWTARRTLGSASMAASRSLRTGRLAGLGQMAVVGRMLTGVADAGAKASYDGRAGLKSVGPLDLGSASDAAKKGRKGEIDAIKKSYEEHRESVAKEDETKYKLAKEEYKNLEEKLGTTAAEALVASYKAQLATGATPQQAAKNVGGSTPDEKAFLKYKATMDDTTAGKVEGEKDAKEKFDKSVTELQNIGARLDQIVTRMNTLNNQKNALVASGVSPNDPQLARVNGEIKALWSEHDQKQGEFGNEYGKYNNLKTEIQKLRTVIQKEQTQYRKNVQETARPNVAGLSAVDRRALREAALGMKKHETEFKPTKLDDALNKALKKRLGLPT